MNITAIGGTAGYTPLNSSQNVNAANSAQNASAVGGGTPSGGASQAASASSGNSSSTSTSTSSSTSSASAVYDPRDLNQDGIVTYAEELQYALTHPLAAQQSQSSAIQSYNQQGQISSNASAAQSTISVYA